MHYKYLLGGVSSLCDVEKHESRALGVQRHTQMTVIAPINLSNPLRSVVAADGGVRRLHLRRRQEV